MISDCAQLRRHAISALVRGVADGSILLLLLPQVPAWPLQGRKIRMTKDSSDSGFDGFT